MFIIIINFSYIYVNSIVSRKIVKSLEYLQTINHLSLNISLSLSLSCARARGLRCKPENRASAVNRLALASTCPIKLLFGVAVFPTVSHTLLSDVRVCVTVGKKSLSEPRREWCLILLGLRLWEFLFLSGRVFGWPIRTFCSEVATHRRIEIPFTWCHVLRHTHSVSSWVCTLRYASLHVLTSLNGNASFFFMPTCTVFRRTGHVQDYREIPL